MLFVLGMVRLSMVILVLIGRSRPNPSSLNQAEAEIYYLSSGSGTIEGSPESVVSARDAVQLAAWSEAYSAGEMTMEVARAIGPSSSNRWSYRGIVAQVHHLRPFSFSILFAIGSSRHLISCPLNPSRDPCAFFRRDHVSSAEWT